MTVEQLIEVLQNMPQEAQVRIAYQPNYPLSSALAGVKHDEGDDEGIGIVYLCEGGDNQYARKSLWEDMEGSW